MGHCFGTRVRQANLENGWKFVDFQAFLTMVMIWFSHPIETNIYKGILWNSPPPRMPSWQISRFMSGIPDPKNG